MSQEPEAGVEPDADQPDRPARGPNAVVRWVATALLAALLAGAVVFAVTSFRQHRADEARAADRREVISVAEQFTLRLDTLSYKNVPAYEKRINSLLTTKMRTQFASAFSEFTKVYQAIQFSSTGEVKAVGISDLDGDSATVLVIHDVKVTSKGCVQPPYKRMTVDLRKVGGQWRVDDFQEGVPGCQG